MKSLPVDDDFSEDREREDYLRTQLRNLEHMIKNKKMSIEEMSRLFSGISEERVDPVAEATSQVDQQPRASHLIPRKTVKQSSINNL